MQYNQFHYGHFEIDVLTSHNLFEHCYTISSYNYYDNDNNEHTSSNNNNNNNDDDDDNNNNNTNNHIDFHTANNYNNKIKPNDNKAT